MTYEKGLFAQADPGIVSGSTNERKKMSTKTIYKRIALVAVTTLGAGVLSVAPASAAALIDLTTTAVATSTPVSTTIGTPSAVGSAITATINVSLAAAPDAGGTTIGATYVLTDPNGAVVTPSATFTSAAAAVAGVTPTNTGAVYAFAIANAAASPANKAIGTVSFTPTTAGRYRLSVTTANTVLGTDITNTAITAGSVADFYVSGSGSVVSASGIGTTTIGAVAGGVAKVRFGTDAHGNSTVYNLTSSGVGSIQTIEAGTLDFTGRVGIAAASDFSQGARLTTDGDTTFNDAVAVVTSTVAGTQTLTFTRIDSTTGAPTVVATQVITWGATPVVSAGTTTARVNAATGTTADGADTTIVVSRLLATQAANIVVTVRDGAGAALAGQTLSATITGSGLIRAVDGAAAGNGIARATSIPLTGNVGSVHVNADGTAGVGTITILVGTTVVATKTVTFFGAPATITAVQNHRVLSTAGGAIGSNTNVPTGADIANTPSVILTVLDANGTRIPGLTTADITAVSSDLTVMSNVINIQENAGTAAGNTVSRTYNVQVSSLAKASGSTATLTFRVALGTTPATFASAAPLTYTLGGSVASVALSLDKASYSPGEAATATLRVRDAAGNAAFDGDHANITSAALTSSLGITGSLVFGANGTTVSSLGGVAAAKINAPATSGTWTISGTTGTGPITAAEKNKALTASATVVAPANAEIASLTTLVNSLIAKINALNKLVVKIQKKVRA
jgi:trimeric autotransporter adhesin